MSIKKLRNKYLKEVDENDLQEYPDLEKTIEVIEDTLDEFVSMLESLSNDLDDELGDDFYTSTLSRLEGDYERFLTSMKSFLTLLKMRGYRDSE